MKKLFLLCLVTLSAVEVSFSQWTQSTVNCTPVSVMQYSQKEVRVRPDGKGGAVAVWLDHRTDPTDSADADIYAQRLDKNGYAKWTTNGIGICVNTDDQPSCNIVEDGASGAIIIWRSAESSNNIYANRIDSSGNPKWGPPPNYPGVLVCNDINDDYNDKSAKAVSDFNGGAIVSWQRRDESGNPPYPDWEIVAQKLTGNGTLAWGGGTPQQISNVSTGDQESPRIETDGAGGAIIVWMDMYQCIPPADSLICDIDIRANRITSAGTKPWNLGVSVCTDLAFQLEPKIEPDGSNGAIIVWVDSSSNPLPGDTTNIYAQRIRGSDGAVQWGLSSSKGKAICTTGGDQTAHDLASEGISGAIIAWKDNRNPTKDIYAQSVDLNGNSLWTLGGIPIANSALTGEGNPNLWGDGAGGVLFVWQDSTGINGDVYAQRINANGVPQWAAGGAPVATNINQQNQCKHVPDGAGGLICFFVDSGNGNGLDIYAQHLFWNGTTNGMNDVSGNNADVKCFPNPFNSEATIEIKDLGLRNKNLKLDIYDVFGREVNPEVIPSSAGFVIRRGNLSQGIYFYELTSLSPLGEDWGEVIATGKFIITD